jgi:hypothetical protein
MKIETSKIQAVRVSKKTIHKLQREEKRKQIKKHLKEVKQDGAYL